MKSKCLGGTEVLVQEQRVCLNVDRLPIDSYIAKLRTAWGGGGGGGGGEERGSRGHPFIHNMWSTHC